jgi:glycosyltransferase involved in cell wall biosynthesis
MSNRTLHGDIEKIAILGNYLPRQCGIATFTTDLAEAIAGGDHSPEVDVVAMVEQPGTVYPDRVARQLVASDFSAYGQAAEFLNRGGYDLLSVQHEYGIFGGEAGTYLLALLHAVKMPIVTTMHTVLRDPTQAQRDVTQELLQLSERLVVMSKAAITILEREYGLPRDRIDLIPHGIPDFSQARRPDIKKSLGIEGPMILTFGLLSPDKGIQFAIGALPEILESCPGGEYVVLGATHPKVKEAHGEQYRDSLLELSRSLGVADRVKFIDRFVSQEELVEYLVETDIYITPYLNPQQITSGTLAYALGAGKAVVSTPYLYASEFLDNGRGLLVPFRDSAAIAEAVVSLHSRLADAEERPSGASGFVQGLLWPAIGRRYVSTFGSAIQQNAARLKALSHYVGYPGHDMDPGVLSSRHLATLTDDTGLFQHADRTVPNRAHGYCVDDNARALLLTVMLEQCGALSPRVEAMQNCYLSFIHDSLDRKSGRFRNFLSFQREWLEPHGSDDSHARTLWALGAVANRSRKHGHRELARELFKCGVPALYDMSSPRAWAYAVLAADELLSAGPIDREAQTLMSRMADQLLRQYRTCQAAGWHWFEDVASYANARLSQAMIVAGQKVPSSEMLSCGLESLTWLMERQRSGSGCFRPIGSEGHLKRGSPPARYDQQPIEACATISGCISAARATGAQAWITQAAKAFSWFLGENDLGVPLYDHSTGGCRDGLHADRPNENQGAESTLSFLCALLEIRSVLPSKASAETAVAHV